MIKISTAEFKWSTTEQVYPFEKDSSGRTLYCKEINLNTLPNNGHIYVAHGITGLTGAKVFNCLLKAHGTTYWLAFTFGLGGTGIYSGLVTDGTIRVSTSTDLAATGVARIIYAK